MCTKATSTSLFPRTINETYPICIRATRLDQYLHHCIIEYRLIKSGSCNLTKNYPNNLTIISVEALVCTQYFTLPHLHTHSLENSFLLQNLLKLTEQKLTPNVSQGTLNCLATCNELNQQKGAVRKQQVFTLQRSCIFCSVQKQEKATSTAYNTTGDLCHN